MHLSPYKIYRFRCLVLAITWWLISCQMNGDGFKGKVLSRYSKMMINNSLLKKYFGSFHALRRAPPTAPWSKPKYFASALCQVVVTFFGKVYNSPQLIRSFEPHNQAPISCRSPTKKIHTPSYSSCAWWLAWADKPQETLCYQKCSMPIMYTSLNCPTTIVSKTNCISCSVPSTPSAWKPCQFLHGNHKTRCWQFLRDLKSGVDQCWLFQECH